MDVAQGVTTPDRTTRGHPLVTFALFAYNQEKYIREAVEGAFSQTYEPLEIILSDDASSDRTYAIMEELALAYRGPHRVRAVRQAENAGTVDHLLGVAAAAQGELIVVAAGDDVSLPERTEAMAEAWMRSDAIALYTGRIVMDEAGNRGDVDLDFPPHPRIQEIFSGATCARRYDGVVRHIPGYSAAYSRKFLLDIPPSQVKALNEDALTTVIANLLGGHIEFVERPLVLYRLSETSISPRMNDMSFESVLQGEMRLLAFSRSSVRFYPYLRNMLRSYFSDRRDAVEVEQRLLKNQHEAVAICAMYDGGFLQKLKFLLTCRTIEEFKPAVPRVFGIRLFALMKASAHLLSH